MTIRPFIRTIRLQRAEKLYAAHWKAFRKCKKDNFALISNDADLVSVCLGPPQNGAKSHEQFEPNRRRYVRSP